MSLTKSSTKKTVQEAMIRIPLSSLRCLSGNHKKKKILCEISTIDLQRLNRSISLDEIISEAKLEFVMGKTKSFSDTKKLLAHLSA